MSKTNLFGEIKEVFAVWQNTDLNEGRGAVRIIHFTELEATAKRLAKGCDVQGCDGLITKEQMVEVNGVLYAPHARSFITGPCAEDIAVERELVKARDAKLLREKILDKARALGLTDEEIAALKA